MENKRISDSQLGHISAGRLCVLEALPATHTNVTVKGIIYLYACSCVFPGTDAEVTGT